jgi:ribosomal protein S24E
MEIKILEEKENPLFNRKELKLEIESNVTPSHADTEKLISEKFGAAAENIKINKIEGKFGVRKFLIIVKIYNSKEDKDNFEIKTKKQREAEKKAIEEERKKAKEEKKATEEAAKAEAEKPVEEKTEEPKEETKEEVIETSKEEVKVEEKTE